MLVICNLQLNYNVACNLPTSVPCYAIAMGQIINTHTHTQPFYRSLDFVWDTPGELVPEGTFCHLLDILVQNEDNTRKKDKVWKL